MPQYIVRCVIRVTQYACTIYLEIHSKYTLMCGALILRWMHSKIHRSMYVNVNIHIITRTYAHTILYELRAQYAPTTYRYIGTVVHDTY